MITVNELIRNLSKLPSNTLLDIEPSYSSSIIFKNSIIDYLSLKICNKINITIEVESISSLCRSKGKIEISEVKNEGFTKIIKNKKDNKTS